MDIVPQPLTREAFAPFGDVIDIPKEENKGNDRHGSKVIVVPFDGAAMDRDLAEIAKREKAASQAPGAK